jgi:hypothetical protein
MDHTTSIPSDGSQRPLIPEPDLGMGYLDATEEWSVGRPSDAQKADGLDSFEDRAERKDGSEDRARSTERGVASERLTGARSGRAPDTVVEEKRHGRATIRGLARSVELRRVDGEDVMVFRVDRYDPDGNRLRPVGVEVFHHRGGQISDGEEVSASGRWHDGTLRAEKVVNVTTGAQIRGRRRWILEAVLIAAVLLCAAFPVIIGVLTS